MVEELILHRMVDLAHTRTMTFERERKAYTPLPVAIVREIAAYETVIGICFIELIYTHIFESTAYLFGRDAMHLDDLDCKVAEVMIELTHDLVAFLLGLIGEGLEQVLAHLLDAIAHYIGQLRREQ